MKHWASIGQRRVFLRVAKNCFSTGKSHVPAPTWSVGSLRLDEQHAPATSANMDILAKRACLNLSLLSDNDRERLRQDVGNMLFMMKQVVAKKSTEEEEPLDPATLYDLPRGVTSIPVRVDAVADVEISEMCKRTLLKQRLKQDGAHMYFEADALRKEKQT